MGIQKILGITWASTAQTGFKAQDMLTVRGLAAGEPASIIHRAGKDVEGDFSQAGDTLRSYPCGLRLLLNRALPNLLLHLNPLRVLPRPIKDGNQDPDKDDPNQAADRPFHQGRFTYDTQQEYHDSHRKTYQDRAP